MMNDLFFGQSNATGKKVPSAASRARSRPRPSRSPSSTAPRSTRISASCTRSPAIPLVRVASGPIDRPVLGQQRDRPVHVRRRRRRARRADRLRVHRRGSGNITTITNQLSGTTPELRRSRSRSSTARARCICTSTAASARSSRSPRRSRTSSSPTSTSRPSPTHRARSATSPRASDHDDSVTPAPRFAGQEVNLGGTMYVVPPIALGALKRCCRRSGAPRSATRASPISARSRISSRSASPRSSGTIPR
jgi:hypothetical protein